MKKIKVLIEIPRNWLDADLTGNIEWITRGIRGEIKNQVKNAVADKIMKEIKMPKIDKNKLKKQVEKEIISRLADLEEDE